MSEAKRQLQIFRLRLPALSALWMYEVAESQSDAAERLEREFAGKFRFIGDHSEWEIELCPLDDLAIACRNMRNLQRENNRVILKIFGLAAENQVLEAKNAELREKLEEDFNWRARAEAMKGGEG